MRRRDAAKWAWSALSLLAVGCANDPGSLVLTTTADSLPGVVREASGGFGISTRTGLKLDTNLAADSVASVDKAATPAAPGQPVTGSLVLSEPGGGTPISITLDPSNFDPITGELRSPLSLPASGTRDVSLFLRDVAGKLVASAYQKAVPMTGTPPTLDVTWNRETPQLIGAANNVNVSDGVVIKGAQLSLKSGMADAQPGVDHVDVELSGPAYGDGTQTALIATYKAPQLADYSWQPDQPSGSYDPSLLKDGSTASPFTLTTKTYSVDGNLVGVDVLHLEIIGTATVGVSFTPPDAGPDGTRIVSP